MMRDLHTNLHFVLLSPFWLCLLQLDVQFVILKLKRLRLACKLFYIGRIELEVHLQSSG